VLGCWGGSLFKCSWVAEAKALRGTGLQEARVKAALRRTLPMPAAAGRERRHRRAITLAGVQAPRLEGARLEAPRLQTPPVRRKAVAQAARQGQLQPGARAQLAETREERRKAVPQARPQQGAGAASAAAVRAPVAAGKAGAQ